MSRSKIPPHSSSGSGGGGRHDSEGAAPGASRMSSGSPPPKPKRENFFDMPKDHDMDIWSPGFSKDLKKESSAHQVAAAVVEDDSVEKVGGAFIDEERSLKIPAKRTQKASGSGGGMFSISEADGAAMAKVNSHLARSKTYSHQAVEPKKKPERPAVTRPDLAYDRVKELEDKLERLEIGLWQPPSIHEIMNRLLLGKPVSMSWFKSMEDKMQLLDAAIATNDGNCVMGVVLFIKRTVNEGVFLNVLESRHVAAQHYINFLKQLRSWRDLQALYRRLNHMETLAYFYLQECDSVGLSSGERIRLIKSCPTEFRKVPHLSHPDDLQHVEEFSRLVNVQQRIEEGSGQGSSRIQPGTVLFHPLTSTLLFCCRHFRGQERKAGNPEELRKLFNIPENQYFQMDLLALALRKDWKGIERLVTTKGVLGIGKKKKSPIGFERVVRLLGQERYRATNDVLEGYLNEIDDLEERYSLAMEVGLYTAGLDALIGLKDRDRVSNFINSVPPIKHYEVRDKIDQALRNSQIKWK